MDYRTVGRFYTKASELAPILGLTEEETRRLEEICREYPMQITDYYLSLIDRENPEDPVRKMCIPSLEEAGTEGSFDTSGEAGNTVMTGLQHKYKETVLILSTNRCAMYCRHCFRKRMVGLSDSEIARNFEEMMEYLRVHKEVSNVLVSGGDSFLMPNSLIRRYLESLSEMEHLDLIRFGTRVPVVYPQRILQDQELQELFREYAKKKQIYLVTQFNHPRELTEDSKKAVRLFAEMGVVVKNQTVLLRGVNADPQVLGRLLRELTAAGVVPYYIFQCRPVRGVGTRFQVPLEEGARIVDQAKNMQNGQGKCVRYCMSNRQGKVEILGTLQNGEMLFKFHQAKDPKDAARIFTRKLQPGQAWVEA